MKNRIAILIALVTLTASLCWGQAPPFLEYGAVSFGADLGNAFEFTLHSGFYLPNGPQSPGGFSWVDGKFNLYADSADSGECANVCQFFGTYGQQSVAQLDNNCVQVSLPILTGRLQVGNAAHLPIQVHAYVTGLYSQTFCTVGGNMFMAGGSLVVYYPVGKRKSKRGF